MIPRVSQHSRMVSLFKLQTGPVHKASGLVASLGTQFAEGDRLEGLGHGK